MFKSSLIFSFFLLAGVANAADPVTDAIQKTYAPYRVALFKTNSNARDEAARAIAQAQQGWATIVERFGTAPPAPYENDPAFADSLAAVSKIYSKAAEQVEKNELIEAHETLEHARDLMAEMRHRNQVIVYSDHMNAYHAQMEKVLIDGEKTLSAPDGLMQLTAEVGALDYLAGKLKSEAPAEYLSNDEFSAMYKALVQSVNDLKATLFAGNVAAAKAAIGRMKPPYSKMFIKFG